MVATASSYMLDEKRMGDAEFIGKVMRENNGCCNYNFGAYKEIEVSNAEGFCMRV